jgi:hypothetical protein
MEWVASTLTLPRNMVYPALLPLMRTPRLPAVGPVDLNGLVSFAERRNLVSARVPSRFKRTILTYESVSCTTVPSGGKPAAAALLSARSPLDVRSLIRYQINNFHGCIQFSDMQNLAPYALSRSRKFVLITSYILCTFYHTTCL